MSNLRYFISNLLTRSSPVFDYLVNNPFLKELGTERAKLELFVIDLKKFISDELILDLQLAA